MREPTRIQWLPASEENVAKTQNAQWRKAHFWIRARLACKKNVIIFPWLFKKTAIASITDFWIYGIYIKYTAKFLEVKNVFKPWQLNTTPINSGEGSWRWYWRFCADTGTLAVGTAAALILSITLPEESHCGGMTVAQRDLLLCSWRTDRNAATGGRAVPTTSELQLWPWSTLFLPALSFFRNADKWWVKSRWMEVPDGILVQIMLMK